MDNCGVILSKLIFINFQCSTEVIPVILYKEITVVTMGEVPEAINSNLTHHAPENKQIIMCGTNLSLLVVTYSYCLLL